MKLSSSGYPMERIATDILGPLPETDKRNRYILVITDYFTKWVEAYPIPDQRAETVAKCLVDEVISRFGVQSYIHSDQADSSRVNCIRRCVFYWILRKQGLHLIIHKVMEWLKDSTKHWRHYFFFFFFFIFHIVQINV